MAVASKSKILYAFTILNNKGKLVLLLGFVLVLVLLMRKVRNSDLAKSEPVFRRNLKRVRRSDDEFCVVSYNILADGPIRRNANAYLPLSVKEKLKEPDPKTAPRHKQLMKELQWLNPDIINMQEVELPYFSILEEELDQSGFEGVHEPHYEGQNGLATFYNTKKFKMEKWVSYNFNELLAKLFDLNQFEKKNKYSQRVVVFSHLIEIKTGKSLVVANLHSMFQMWRFPDMQALQISLFMQQLHKFVTEVTSQQKGPVPWIISGDFNTYPYFPLYDIITSGNVTNEGMERLNPYKYKYPQVVKKAKIEEGESIILKYGRKYLSHPLKDVKSAYKTVLVGLNACGIYVSLQAPLKYNRDNANMAIYDKGKPSLPREAVKSGITYTLTGREPLLTHYQINKDFPQAYGFEVMKGTLDYIWYSSSTLRVNAVLQHVKEDVIKPLVACPNKFFPSDHLSMKACFGFVDS